MSTRQPSTEAELRRLKPRRLGPLDPFWPPLWRQMPDPPTEVTVTGEAAWLARRALAIVGTRKATPRGMAVATALATELARAGWIIVSGMACGIDAAAHRGALQGGATVAVLGTGIAHTYPAVHRRLRLSIETGGCVVTELPDDTLPARWTFPKRNRLIAGMAEGVIVVDAPERSGALLTAYLALDMDREVFAVPGPVDRPESRGCHNLLREGATLVESPADVHQVLTPPGGGAGAASEERTILLPAPGSAARWIYDRLDLEGEGSTELARRWPGSAGSWAEGLVALEMAGLIRRLPGGRLARRHWDWTDER